MTPLCVRLMISPVEGFYRQMRRMDLLPLRATTSHRVLCGAAAELLGEEPSSCLPSLQGYLRVTLGWFPTGSIYLLFRFTLNNEGCCWETLVSALLDLVLLSSTKGTRYGFSYLLKTNSDSWS